MKKSNRIPVAEFLLIVIILFLSAMAVAPEGKCEVVVLVDDFGADYSIEAQRDLLEIMTRHDTHATLFVIPNHNLNAPISKNTDLSTLLLESGLPLGMHGYQHYIGKEGTEFQFLTEVGAGHLIGLGNKEFQAAFGKGAKIFRAPGNLINMRAQRAVRSYWMLDATFLVAHEYTWYMEEGNKADALEKARYHLQRDCRLRGHYILAAHVGAANDPAGLDFLDRLLSGIDRGTHQFVELEAFLPPNSNI